MKITRLRPEDFYSMWAMWSSHDKYQGLRLDQVFHREQYRIKELWQKHHAAGIFNKDFYYFGAKQDGVLMAFIQYEFFKKVDGERAVAAGTHSTTRELPLAKTYGQKLYPDAIIDISNHAMTYFERKDIEAFYHLARGVLTDRFVPLSDIPQTKLSKYMKELYEFVPSGSYPKDPDMKAHVLKTPRSIDQVIYRYTKE